MVLVGILATISILEAGYSSPVLYIAIFQGLILSLAILAAGPATGGHVNPCITFTEMLTGHISPVRCLLYMLAQSLGSIVAAFWVKVSTINLTSKPKILIFNPLVDRDVNSIYS